MRKSKYKLNWTLRMAAVLLCFVLFTSHLTSGMYAKFSTSANNASDSARVAKFKVEADGVYTADLNLTDMLPNTEKTYTFSIENVSEVDVLCELDIYTTNNLPLSFTMTPEDGKAQALTPGSPLLLNEFDSGNSNPENYTLTVIWPDKEKDVKYAGLLDAIKLIVIAEQID